MSPPDFGYWLHFGVDVELYFLVFQLSNTAENLWVLLLQDPTDGLWVCTYCSNAYPYLQYA